MGSACPRCGAELPDAAKYCDICGHHLSSPLNPQDAYQRPESAGLITSAGPKPVPTHLHQYIPKELLVKLEAAQHEGGMVGERRIVTMLFCDVKGSTSAAEKLDPEEWSEIINGAFEHMIAPVYRYEGTVARLMGDGILAFFGAPIAHEDDAVRALLAGLEIVSGTKDYHRRVRRRYGMEIDVRVGINTGRVVVGAVGSDLRLEYTALGDAINVAARMEQTATPGTVQIAEDTYRLVAPLFELEDLGGVAVKGKAEPVTTYRVLGRKAEPGRLRGIAGLESPHVGREDELSLLTNALDDLRHGRGRIVFVVGQAGLGKSRLIRELHSHWKADESTHEALQFWMQRPTASYQASEAYRVLKNQIRLMYHIGDNEPPEDTIAKLKANAAAISPSLQSGIFEPLARLLGVLEEGETEEVAQGETFRRQLFTASLASIRELAARKPAILVLDDLHWADPASLEVIQYLFQLVDSAPILFLCASRPDRAAPSWDLKAGAEKEYPHRYSETVLRPLSEDDSLAMLDGLLIGMVWPPELKGLILDKSEGNPFFIEEVVRALIDDGIVRRNGSNGHWHTAADVGDFVVPGNLQALLTARIDRLPDKDRQILQLASVIGRSFSYRVLQRINKNTADLDKSLATLQRSDLIVEEASIPARIFRFRRTLLHETIYRSILRKRRQDYHRRVGEALEEFHEGQSDERLPALAHHFYQAKDEKALKYNRLAGDAAFHLYANREAATYLERAIDVAQLDVTVSSEQLTHLYSRRGRVLELVSSFADALANYQEMERVAKERQDRAMELSSLVSAGTIYSTANDQFDPARAEPLADQALAVAQELQDQAAEAKVLWNLMNVYRLSDRPSLALVSGERAMELARQNNLHEQLAFVANDMTHVYFSTGIPKRANEVVHEAIRLWRQLDNKPMLADSLATASLVMVMGGDFERAISFSDESFQISQTIENLWGQSYSRFYIGYFYFLRGELDRAVETMQASVRLGEKAGFMPSQTYVSAHLSLVYAHLGVYEQAIALGRRSLAVAEANMPYYRVFCLSVLGQILLLAGDQQEAVTVFDDLFAINTDREPLIAVTVEEAKCRYNLAQGNYDEAIANAHNLVAALHELDAQVFLPTALQLQGEALLGSEQLDRAGRILADARSEAEQLGLRWPLWQTLTALATLEATLGNRAEAERFQAGAREIFEDIADGVLSPELRASFMTHPHWTTR
jgi:class 3 adenylate cyclase/tetratricopeptide (TPR) repeat protein